MTTPESVYETWRFCEEWWSSVVEYTPTHQDHARRAHWNAVDSYMGELITASTAAALIRDAVVRHLHTLGIDVRVTGHRPDEGPAYCYGSPCDGLGTCGYSDTYDDALVAAARLHDSARSEP